MKTLALMTEAEQSALREADQSIADLTEVLANVKDSRNNLLRRVKVTCQCGAVFPIGELVYIQTHWYVPPSGRTEGDYCRSGEGQWDCPKCGRNNRLYNQEHIEALICYFGSIHECYCDQGHSCCSDPRPCDACRKVGRTRDGRVRRKEDPDGR